MTKPNINPYEPVAETVPIPTPIEPICFSGVIEKADYQAMLPYDQEWWLCVVSAILLGICILLFGPITVWLAIVEEESIVTIAVFGFWAVMVAAMWFLKSRIGPFDRASRALKKYPDVLGQAAGEISNSGLVFHDGVNTYWFGPEHMKHAAFLKNGIRVNVGGSLYRYLALTSRLFEYYRMESAIGLKDRWAAAALNQLADDATDAYDPWDRVGEPPVDAIRFDGQESIEVHMRTTSLRNRALSGLVSYLTLVLLLMLFRSRMETWLLWAGITLVVYGVLTNIRVWLTHYRKNSQQTWYQFGWINDHEFSIWFDSTAVRMPLTEITSKSVCAELVVLTLRGGQQYHLTRHSFASQEQWERLQAIVVGNPL